LVSVSVLVSGSHDLDLRKALDNYTFGAGIHHVSDTPEGATARAGQYDVDVIVIINHHTISRCTSCDNP